MTRLFFLPIAVFVLLLIGCNKPLAPVETTPQVAYFLEYDIKDIEWRPEDVERDSFSIYAEQDQDVVFRFQDLAVINRIFYFNRVDMLGEDSLALLGQLIFRENTASGFAYDEHALEFVLVEDIANLELQPDGSYLYLDRAYLAERLSGQNWGHQSLFNNEPVQQVILSYPQTFDENDPWQTGSLISNGFYWDYEDLTLSHVVYDEANDRIQITGDFTVEIKTLSCGFYPYYSVRNAHFEAVIE